MAKTNKKDLLKTPRHVLLRITRVHYFYVLIYLGTLIIFDSSNLISHEGVMQRWSVAGALLVVNTVIWYLCRAKLKSDVFYKALFVFLATSDILFAATNVYWQRGMASKAVMLFAIPIISAGLMRSRSLILAITTVSAALYSVATVKYFFENYGQGYRVELYGEIVFYSLLFYILAWLMMISFKHAAD